VPMKFLFDRPAAALRPSLCVLAIGLTLIVPGAAHAQLSASFTFTPESPLTGETVTFLSTSTDVTEPETWDLDRDGLCDDATGPSAQRSFPIAGDYTIKLCVSGDGEDILRRTITIRNRPPVAAFTYSPGTPLIGESVALVSTSFDPDGPIASLAWDLDNDGAFDDGAGVTASLPFSAAGSHVVRLLAIDRDGATSTALQTITVSQAMTATTVVPGPNPPPGPVILFPIVRVVAGVSARGTRIRSLTVSTPPDSRVMVRCRGRGCPFRSRSWLASSRARSSDVRARASELLRVRPLRGRLLRPGAVLEISVTRSGSLGRYTRFRIRKRKAPAREDLCVAPGTELPVRCPNELAVGGPAQSEA
jgi:PKD domain-containing protein